MSSSGRRLRAFAAGVAATALVAAAPVDRNPLQRLAGGAGDGRDPHFDVALIGIDALRSRHPMSGATYVVVARGASPLAQGNSKAVGQLYLARLLPVHDARRAAYVLELRGLRLVLERAE